MAFQISPGVNVSEVDLTTVVPSVLTTAGAFAGTFAWGPANQVILVDNELTFKQIFGSPDANSFVSYFTSASFLAYGNNLSVVRAINGSSNNAVANTSTVNSTQIANEEQYENTILNVDKNNLYGAFMARYPGSLGNSLSVSICANTTLFSSWSYKSYFTSAPGTSTYASAKGGANDEVHIVVVDSGGKFTGTQGTVLEVYPFVSKAYDATSEGETNYYKQVLFNNSQYVYAVDPPSYATTKNNWFTPAANTTYVSLTTNQTLPLSYGNESTVTNGNLQTSYDLFANKE
jgi:hypothetical protein